MKNYKSDKYDTYEAQEKNGMIDKMKQLGGEWVYIGGVDNCLGKIVDPVFMGIAIDRHVTGSELTEKDVDKLVKAIKADFTTQYDERDKVARKLEKDIKNESDVVTQHELEQKLAEVRAEMAEIDDARSNTQMRVTQRLDGSKMTISESGKFKSDD